MRTFWIFIVIATLCSPAVVTLTLSGGTFAIAATVLAIPAGLSFFAFCLGHDLLRFWSVPVAAALPWMAVLLMIGIWVPSLPAASQQGGAMTGMIPMFALLLGFGMGVFVSFFVSRDIGEERRIFWSLICSGIPALLCAAFLAFVFVGER